MRTRVLIVAFSVLAISMSCSIPAQSQQDADRASSRSADENTVEGTVVTSSRDTLLVHTDDDQYRLFTYDRASARSRAAVVGSRVRVTAGPADESGTRSASNIEVVSAPPATTTADKRTKAAPVPEKVREVENDIRRQSRRWNLGVRGGAAFDPELLLFGVQSQMGPIFNPRVFFRPNAEFAFGEVTDLVALNLEAVYRFRPQRRVWAPYVGAGPALIFLHQNFEQGRQIDFGNFEYKTGFNILIGTQNRRGTFVELKSSIYSGHAPKLRMILGYTF